MAVLVFSLDHPTAYIKWNLLSTSHLKIWWCLWHFMAVHCCLPVSIALQDHVPANFRKNLCPFYVSFLSSINSSYHIFGDINIHVDVSGGDGYKFMTFLDSCDLKQFVNQPTHLLGHTLDLILSPIDQDTIIDVKIGDFVSDHALVKCSIILPHQAAHTQNKVKYRRYHRINMSDFRSDL